LLKNSILFLFICFLETAHLKQVKQSQNNGYYFSWVEKTKINPEKKDKLPQEILEEQKKNLK
jgi:hypothetical protein